MSAGLALGCAAPRDVSAPPVEPSPPRGRVATTPPPPAPVVTAGRRAAAVRDPRMEQFVDSVLARMTLADKLGQLNQPTGPGPQTGPEQRSGSEADVRAGRIGSFLGVWGAANTRSLQRIAVEESRLGVPLLFAHDVIHGFRTIFPVPLAESASFDTAAVERAARIAATEGAAHGVHWTYAPMVDLARDPRWGRIVEGAGEDPFLGAAMAAARVRGFQGEDLSADNTMMATAKHFVAYGAAEGGRDYNTADISDITLHEIYLPPFRAAIDAGAGSVMAAFNEIGGVPMHAHNELIDGLLREEWGWDGVLVSDYTGVLELLRHGIAATPAEAGVLALAAGVDVDMVSRIYLEHLDSMVLAAQVDEREIDEAVRRVLRAKYRLGLFEDPYRYADEARERALTLAPEHVAEARALARKAIVLLKNEPHNGSAVLPLRRDIGTIAVIGALASDQRSPLGSWAAAGRAEDAVSVLDGIRAAVAPATTVLYAEGAAVEGQDTSGFAEALRVARRADAVVLVLGEHHDMSAEARNRSSLDLPGVQPELARRVMALGKPTVAVLLNGRPLSIPWLDEHVPAIVEAWYLGVQMGPAVADVLFGDYNPGGKLPVSFPRTVGQVPIYYNHKNTGRPPVESERYTSKYIDVPWTPLYPFGHGLSYTTFEYRQLTLGARSLSGGDSLIVSVELANTGERAGDEVVQLYLSDEVRSITPPVKQLRGFRRVHLQPGEARTVTFTLRSADFAFYDTQLRRLVEPGFFTVQVGGSSASGLRDRFEVVGDVLILDRCAVCLTARRDGSDAGGA
ncbi:MAG: glycoside hydrolase family 3 N-terminal domain-containing protein [Longimicrobiales bacterium]